MTEEEAHVWLAALNGVPRETHDQLRAFVDIVRTEAEQQNLIAQSTLEHVWGRHIVDSAQLLSLVSGASHWIDLGSGAGFPGMVVAIMSNLQVTLVESRRKRIDFLEETIERLNLSPRVTVAGSRAELLPEREYDVISARAFAPLEKLFAIGARFAGPKTIWVLPKGRSAQVELDAVQGTWQGVFRIEQSVTDPDSSIIVAERIRPRKQR